MRTRIVIVGGGSYHWAPRLLCDFANTPSLTDADVVLHDLDADRLALMEDLGHEIARRRGIGLTTTAELDRKQALSGADFVITCFSVGGVARLQHRNQIPPRHRLPPPHRANRRPGRGPPAVRHAP